MSDSNLFHAFDLSASGLSAQRARLNVIAENLANAQTTRTPEGGPYRRRVLTVAEAGGASSDLFERLLNATRNASLGPARTSPKHLEPIDPIRFPNGRNAVTWNVAADETSPLRWRAQLWCAPAATSTASSMPATRTASGRSSRLPSPI